MIGKLYQILQEAIIEKSEKEKTCAEKRAAEGGDAEVKSELLEILKEILSELFLIRRELQTIRLSMRRRSTNVYIDSRELPKLISKTIQKDIRDFKRGEGGTCSKKLMIRYRDWRSKKWRERIWNPPRHVVIETNEAVYIDNKRITNILTTGGVKTTPLGKDSTLVTISFVAKSYRKTN